MITTTYNETVFLTSVVHPYNVAETFGTYDILINAAVISQAWLTEKHLVSVQTIIGQDNHYICEALKRVKRSCTR